MSRHFLLSAVARTLSLSSVFRMSDDEARDTLKRIRWSENNAEPFCPHCGCLIVYTLAEAPPRWKCSACRRKFSLTSGTLFHSRKLAVRDYLAVIALFVNGVNGTSALQIRTAAGEPLSTDDIASRVIAAKGFDSGDAILRAAIREQVGSTVKRLHPNGAIENIGAGRASKWKLAGT
jgi:ribosomal protein L37AE/L43A